MPYIERGLGGNIIRMYANAQTGPNQEHLADNHAQVLAFLNPPKTLAQFLADIDAAAVQVRLKSITPGIGQAMSYREKAIEAVDCLAKYTALLPPIAGIYVLLDSEVGTTIKAGGKIATTAYEVAVVVDSARTAWLTKEAAINRVRVQSKAAVKAATANGRATIMAAIVWP